MRLVVGVLACLGAGAVSLVRADPAAAPAAPTSSASAPAATPTSATAAPAASPARPAVDPLEKLLIAQGYKPEMRNGEKIFCRREQVLGSRLGEVKHCGTLKQLKVLQQDSKEAVDQIQRTKINPPGR